MCPFFPGGNLKMEKSIQPEIAKHTNIINPFAVNQQIFLSNWRQLWVVKLLNKYFRKHLYVCMLALRKEINPWERSWVYGVVEPPSAVYAFIPNFHSSLSKKVSLTPQNTGWLYLLKCFLTKWSLVTIY